MQPIKDFNDLHRAQGPEAVCEKIKAVQKPPYVPFGYTMTGTGVFRVNNEGEADLAVCDPLYIEALARDDIGKNWGRLLTWSDPDGKKHEWAMPNSMLAGDGAEYRRFLLDHGLGIRAGKKAQNALHDYIMTATPKARAVSANMPGWHKKRYIAPDGAVYGQGTDKILLQASGALPKLDRKGTLQSWQEAVARVAQGNSRLVLTISAAFAGPLLRSSGSFLGRTRKRTMPPPGVFMTGFRPVAARGATKRRKA